MRGVGGVKVKHKSDSLLAGALSPVNHKSDREDSGRYLTQRIQYERCQTWERV